MKRTARAFTFIEVLLYIGLFSILGTALFVFAWDTLELSQKSQSNEKVTEETRFAMEKIKYLLRNATGVDEENSVWDDNDGRLVIDLAESSDTIILERRNGQLVSQRSNQAPVPLHSSVFETSIISFERYYKEDGRIGSVGITLGLETMPGLPREYATGFTLTTAVFLRNLGL